MLLCITFFRGVRVVAYERQFIVNALRAHARKLLHEYKRSPIRNKIGVWKDATIWRTLYAVVYECDETIERW